MYDILKVTAFGFVFELTESAGFFTAKKEYEILLNGEVYTQSDKNVVALMSLKSDTLYDVMVKGFADEDITFSVRTLKPGFLVNVKDYNATGDGVTCDTSAINLAIYAAPSGSTVFVPRGEYIVDQVLLKSGVDIYLEKGAIIKQSTDRDKLAVLKGYQRNFDHTATTINASWEGNPLDSYASLIYGKQVKNVQIYGEGVLDGNGEASGFWVKPKIKNRAYRPKNILLVECKNIEIIGITSRNSASWNIHPFYCDNISFLALKIESAKDSPNTDGINPESCNDVEIIGCHFDVGDDCIAIKSGKFFMSEKHRRATTNVTIRQCLMEKGHGGVVIGSEMSCGVNDVTVTNCLFRGTDRGLRIKTRRGRGKHAVVDGVTFKNVQMERVRHAFVVNMFYNCDPDGKSDYVKDKDVQEKDEYTPTVKNLSFTHIVTKEMLGCAIFIYGLPENKVSGVRIENCSFSVAKQMKRIHECPAMMCDFKRIKNLGTFIKNAENVVMQDNEFIGEVVSVCEY